MDQPTSFPTGPTPWIEAYYGDGTAVFRLYARKWKLGEDPTKDELWRVVLQPVTSSGKVLAEQVKDKDIDWVEHGQERKWASAKLGPTFRELRKAPERSYFNVEAV